MYPNSKTFHIQVDEILNLDKELQIVNFNKPEIKPAIYNRYGHSLSNQRK